MSLGYDPIIRDIPDFPLYQISENGEVYNKITGLELKQQFDNNNGYSHIRLCKDGKGHTKRIHRLLAEIFIDNPLNKPCVDHIDMNKLNNKLENLRWVNYSENNTNKLTYKNNTSGNVGVYKKYDKTSIYWLSRIIKDKKQYQKNFPYTNEGFNQATNWYKDMKEKLHIYN
jgi:hypothetical protein